MATADTGDGDTGPLCARDFVQERLREADSVMSPSDLAEEYGCTNGHIRNLMMDLVEDDEVERVAHGRYVAATDDEDGVADDLQDDVSGSSEGNAEATADGAPQEPTTQETSEPVDGEAPSEGRDTEATEGDESGEDGMGGIPLPCSTTTLAVGVVLALVVVWWMTRDSGESGQQNQQDEQDEGFAEDLEDVTGGLVG